MAGLRITRRALGAPQVSDELLLDVEALAAPVVSAGRDWLGLQGRGDASQFVATAAWVPGAGPLESRLVVELSDRAGAVAWTGEVPPAEWGRLATRAGLALTAAGVWAPAPGPHEIRYELRFEPSDPSLHAPQRLDLPRPEGAAGIEWGTTVNPPETPWIESAALDDSRCVCAAPVADLIVLFSDVVWTEVVALAHESHAVREERALVLFGARHRLRTDRGPAPVVPVFLVERCTRPRLQSADAAGLVFEHSTLIEDARGAIALLHTHPAGCSLEASDHDWRDLEDLATGGPAAISIIVGAIPAHADREPALAVHARLGARGGRVMRAAAAIHVTQEVLRHAI